MRWAGRKVWLIAVFVPGSDKEDLLVLLLLAGAASPRTPACSNVILHPHHCHHFVWPEGDTIHQGIKACS